MACPRERHSQAGNRIDMPSLLPIGGAVRLNPTAGGAATIVPLDNGGFTRVYRTRDRPDLFRLFGADFQPVGDETGITAEDTLAPQATALNDGRFMVAWLAQEQTIQASVYERDGPRALGPIVLVTPTDPMFGLSVPRIVGNAFGGVTAVW